MNLLVFNLLKILKILYKECLALVYPSYLWPSNIPPLEAISHNCPTFVPDIDEAKLFLKDSVSYFNINAPHSLAQQIIDTYNNGYSQERLVSSKLFLKNYLSHKELKDILIDIISDYSRKKVNWS